jgi:hypothetical protein
MQTLVVKWSSSARITLRTHGVKEPSQQGARPGGDTLWLTQAEGGTKFSDLLNYANVG